MFGDGLGRSNRDYEDAMANVFRRFLDGEDIRNTPAPKPREKHRGFVPHTTCAKCKFIYLTQGSMTKLSDQIDHSMIPDKSDGITEKIDHIEKALGLSHKTGIPIGDWSIVLSPKDVDFCFKCQKMTIDGKPNSNVPKDS